MSKATASSCISLLSSLAQQIARRTSTIGSGGLNQCGSAAAKALSSASLRNAIAASGGGASMIRSFSSSLPILSSNLVNVLNEEIKHEEESYAKPAEIQSGPPAPWKLLDCADGDTLITLASRAPCWHASAPSDPVPNAEAYPERGGHLDRSPREQPACSGIDRQRQTSC